MSLELAGRTALVLGGSKGLGLGVAMALAAKGARIGIVGRDAAALTAAVARIGNKAVAFAADMGKAEAVDLLVAAVTEQLGQVDILLLNGGGPPPFPAAVFEAALWREQFEAMVLNQIRLTTAFLPGMRDRQWGRVLIVSSTSVREPIADLTASNALRAALAGWAKTLAGEVAAENVTVNLLLPGRLATDRTEMFDRLDAEARGVTPAVIAAESQAEIPMRRYGTPAEFGAVAAFLASEGAAYVTGAAIPVDGGLSRGML